MEFYTYVYLREDGTPYYVGKGKGRRAFHVRHNVPVPSERCRILIQEFPSEEDALVAERFLIAYYGRKDLGSGILRNLTDGGDGISGFQHLPESKERTRASLLGKKHTEERRRHLRESHLGKSWTAAQRAARPIGRKNSDEHKRKISASNMGHVVSDATRRKLSESNGVFTKTQLDEILRIRITGISLRKIAEMFGVSRPCIGNICSGKTYRR